MKNKICKIVLQGIAKCAIFAVLIVITSSCSAKKKVVEQGSSLDAQMSQSTEVRHDVAESEDSVFVITRDTVSAQMSARIQQVTMDTTSIVRITDYDAVTGLPVRTVETERRAVQSSSDVYMEMAMMAGRYLEELNLLRRRYDSLLIAMQEDGRVASRDSTSFCQEREPAMPVHGSVWNLIILIAVAIAVSFAYRFYRR